jgi:hypothetical protein
MSDQYLNQGRDKVSAHSFFNAGKALGITGFMDFVHTPEFQITIEHNVSETGSVSILRWGGGRHLHCWVL